MKNISHHRHYRFARLLRAACTSQSHASVVSAARVFNGGKKSQCFSYTTPHSSFSGISGSQPAVKSEQKVNNEEPEKQQLGTFVFFLLLLHLNFKAAAIHLRTRTRSHVRSQPEASGGAGNTRKPSLATSDSDAVSSQ